MIYKLSFTESLSFAAGIAFLALAFYDPESYLHRENPHTEHEPIPTGILCLWVLSIIAPLLAIRWETRRLSITPAMF